MGHPKNAYRFGTHLWGFLLYEVSHLNTLKSLQAPKLPKLAGARVKSPFSPASVNLGYGGVQMKSDNSRKQNPRTVVEQPIPGLTRWGLFELNVLHYRAFLIGWFIHQIRTMRSSTTKTVRRVAHKIKWTSETAIIFVTGMPAEEKVKNWKRTTTTTGQISRSMMTSDKLEDNLSKIRTTTEEMSVVALVERSQTRLPPKLETGPQNASQYY